MAAPEYLLEAERVTVPGGLVGGRINILRMFRREVFGVFVMMKSARMRKTAVSRWVHCKLDVRSNSNNLPHKRETARECIALMAQTHPDTQFIHIIKSSVIQRSSEGQAFVRILLTTTCTEKAIRFTFNNSQCWPLFSVNTWRFPLASRVTALSTSLHHSCSRGQQRTQRKTQEVAQIYCQNLLSTAATNYFKL